MFGTTHSQLQASRREMKSALDAIRDQDYFSKPVLEKLGELSVESLRFLKEDDLVALVDNPMDKLKMKVAVRQYLLKYMTNDVVPNYLVPVVSFSFNEGNGCLTAKSLMSVSFRGVFIHDADTVEDIPDQLKELGVDPEKVKILDLSEQNLIDADVGATLKVVTSLPNCEVVNLAYNRITGSDEKSSPMKSLEGLLAMPQIKFVSITGNYVVSYSNRSILHEPPHAVEKLVWISYQQLNFDEWKCMCPRHLVDSIIKTHVIYFGTYHMLH
jgi:hypothetical protein